MTAARRYCGIPIKILSSCPDCVIATSCMTDPASVESVGFRRRFAGRVETGRDSLSDPALGGRALGDQE